MTVEELRALQESVPDRADLVDITGYQFDMEAPAAARAEAFLQYVKNPYHFRCGDIAVNLQFDPEGKTLEEALRGYLTAKAGL